MAVRPTSLGLENLESRLNLSTLVGVAVVDSFNAGIRAQERTTLRTHSRMIDLNAQTGAARKAVAKPAVTIPLVAANSDSAAPNVTLSPTTSSISILWTNNALNATGFRVDRSTDGVNFTSIAVVSPTRTSFTDAKVVAGTDYTYRVTVFNKNNSAVGNTATTALIPPPPPVAPTLLTDVKNSLNSVSLAWHDNSNNETGFQIYRSTGGSDFTLLTTTKANAKSFTDTSLASGTAYVYEIAAVNAGGQTFSNGNCTATTAAPPTTAPINLAFSNINSSSVTLTWADSSTTLSGFRVYRSSAGSAFTLVGNVESNTDTFTDTNLTASTKYTYEVSAWNASSNEFSKPLAATTLAAAPNAPSTPTFTNVTTTSLTLSWTSNSTNQTGYHIYRSNDGTHFALVGTTGANDLSFNDQNLDPGSTYWYNVAAYNPGGETASTTAFTTIATTVNNQSSQPPSTPGSLSLTNVSSSSLTLNWVDENTTGATGIHIYRSTDGSNYTLADTVGTGATSWNDSNLTASTTYYYEIAAYNSNGETKSNAAHATTLSPPVISNPVSFTTQNMTSFTELDITGTTSNDSIVVSQSNGILNIIANGQTYNYTNTFGDLKIFGVNGNDTITVNSSVNIATLIYGGNGNDIINNLTTGKATIVTIGNGTNTVTGNGINTSYWVNPTDTVNATAAEFALGGVNRVSNFYQPFTTVTTAANYIPRSLAGQNLPDPTDSGTETRLTNSSLWGTGASINDINQTSISDCYFLAPLASLAFSEPQKLMNMAVDLGDGTYAFRFVRNGVTSFVRVDGDLSAGGPWAYGLVNATPGADGNEWGSLFEKAYAFFRSGSNTYASLNMGYQGNTYSDLGLTTSSMYPGSASGSTAMNTINTALAANRGVVASTNGNIASGAPLIGSHVYTVIGAYTNSTGTVMIQLRNPWGIDGANDGSNPNDGIVTISFATFSTNFNMLNWVNA